MFLPTCSTVRAEGAAPTQAAWVLHGILGAGANLRSFARALAGRHPGWAFVLVDLRNHGDSRGAPPPHTVDACASDLLALGDTLPLRPCAAIGHSFGGKVALRWSQRAKAQGQPARRVWMLDASPSRIAPGDSLGSEVVQVLGSLREVPQPLASRDALVEWLGERGFGRTLALWMTTNLRHTPDGLRWRFDLDAVEAMLADYGACDLWPWLHDPARQTRVEVVAAERGARFTAEERARFRGVPGLALHALPDSGHWVHVDNPQGLLELVSGVGVG